jgi:hypothetical protein
MCQTAQDGLLADSCPLKAESFSISEQLRARNLFREAVWLKAVC